MTDCVFCKIIEREAKALILYEDESVISFLPIQPEVYGHTLIAPKAHYADIYDIPNAVLSHVMATAKLHSLHYREIIHATGMNLMHASGVDGEQSVFHFHLHLLPRFKSDGLKTWPVLPGISIDPQQMYLALRFALAS